MGKQQAFIDLARAGGSRQDFIDLAASFGLHDPGKALMIHDMMMSGALQSELKHGGIASLAPRSGYARGGWSPGVGRDERGYQSTHPSFQGGGGGGGGATIETPVIDRSNVNVEPISTTGQNQYLNKFGVGINRNKSYAAGLLSLEDLMEGSIKPDIYAGYTGDNFNISGQKTKDMTGVDASTMIGPVNVTGSYQDYDGDVNKNISATSNLGGVDFGVNYDFENKPTFGASLNTDNFSGGVTYDGKPKAMFSFSKKLEPRPKILGKNYAEGGLAGILEV